jgi:hypothetical protein
MAHFRAPASETNSISHAYQICQLTTGRVGWPAEIHIKEGRPSCGHSFNTRTRKSYIKKEETMPGHNASWTRHYSAQHSTLPSGTRPCNGACISHYNHHGTLASQSSIQRCTIAHARPDASSPYRCPALRLQPTLPDLSKRAATISTPYCTTLRR